MYARIAKWNISTIITVLTSLPLLPLCVNAISIKLWIAQYVTRLRDIWMHTRVPRNVIFIGTQGLFLHELRVRSVKGDPVRQVLKLRMLGTTPQFVLHPGLVLNYGLDKGYVQTRVRVGWFGIWIPVGTKAFPSSIRSRPFWGPSSLPFDRYEGSFPGIKQPGREVNHLELCRYFPSMPS